MDPILLHPFIFYFLLVMLFLFIGAFTWFIIKYIQIFTKDIIIFIDKSNRWKVIYDNLQGRDDYSYKEKKYILEEKSAILNNKGKALYVFSENKPQSMAIGYNSAKWLTSESLMNVVNNKMLTALMKLSGDMSDKLMLFGALGGIIAGIASVLILLKTFGIM